MYQESGANIEVLLTVDWEGSDLRPKNLETIKRFKERYQVPLFHFLNPAYYTQDLKLNNTAINDSICSVLTSEDGRGLHLHPSRHLVEAAGLTFQPGPTFSRRGKCTGLEEGADVMLHAYPYQDLERLIGFSRDVLESQGFSDLEGFRAGGWMADPTVCECVKLHGLEFESSGTLGSLLNGSSWEGDNLQRYIEILWPEIHMNSSPYWMETSFGELLEVPNNLGAVDYWSEEAVDFFVSTTLNEGRQQGRYLAVINSHQETASDHWYKMGLFVERLQQACETQGVGLKFISSPRQRGQWQEDLTLPVAEFSL